MTSNSSHEQFVRLLAAHQGRIHAFVMTMVLDWSAAEELFQDTCIVLWKKFDQFEPGTDFASWGCGIAYRNVLHWRKQQARRREVYDDEFLASVAAIQEEMTEEFDSRRRALAVCVKKLSPKDQELLRLRYVGQRQAKQVAQEVNRTTGSVYKSLQRIRRVLFCCIQLRLRQEERV